jgi:hypothetical protein
VMLGRNAAAGQSLFKNDSSCCMRRSIVPGPIPF